MTLIISLQKAASSPGPEAALTNVSSEKGLADSPAAKEALLIKRLQKVQYNHFISNFVFAHHVLGTRCGLYCNRRSVASWSTFTRRDTISEILAVFHFLYHTSH